MSFRRIRFGNVVSHHLSERLKFGVSINKNLTLDIELAYAPHFVTKLPVAPPQQMNNCFIVLWILMFFRHTLQEAGQTKTKVLQSLMKNIALMILRRSTKLRLHCLILKSASFKTQILKKRRRSTCSTVGKKLGVTQCIKYRVFRNVLINVNIFQLMRVPVCHPNENRVTGRSFTGKWKVK